MSSEIDQKKKEIQDELDRLKYEYKVEFPKRINDARELGDLKENADYHAARERQGFVKALIAQLTDQLNKLNSMSGVSLPVDSVAFGSSVTIKNNKTGAEMNLSFVLDGDVNPSQGKISLATPFGRALAGKKIGEMAEVTLPGGVTQFTVIYLKTMQGEEYRV